MEAESVAEDAAEEQNFRAPSVGLSLLGALVIAARHRGVHLSVAQLIHDHLLGPDDPSPARLVQIAESSGLRATLTRLDWSDLTRLGTALPAIILLDNGSAMVVLQAMTGTEPARVVLQDPNAHEDAPLVLDEGRLCAAWSGAVILLKRDPAYHRHSARD